MVVRYFPSKTVPFIFIIIRIKIEKPNNKENSHTTNYKQVEIIYKNNFVKTNYNNEERIVQRIFD